MPIPRHRRLIVDLLRYQREIPTVPHARLVDLGTVNDLRRVLSKRISLPAIMIRAFGLVSAKFPQLRQTYMRGPVPHIYEHPFSIAMIALAREYRGHPWLFFARISRPEYRTLTDIQERMDRFATAPVGELFGEQLRVAAAPWPIRAMLWRARLHLSGRKRVDRLGTFGLTTLAGKGVSISDAKAPISYVLTYGPFDDDQRVQVTVVYDHRLIDGSTVADVLVELENVLRTRIYDEMRKIPSSGFRVGAGIVGPQLEGSA